MVHIKEPLLLIEINSSWVGNSGFSLSLSEWSFNVLSASLNKSRILLVCSNGNPQKQPFFYSCIDHESDSERGNPLLPHGLLFRLAARVLLHASFHRQDNTYHSLCYTSCGTLGWTRNSPMGPSWRIDPMTHRTMSQHSYHEATSCSLLYQISIISGYVRYTCIRNKNSDEC